MKVPFIDLTVQYENIKPAIDKAIQLVLQEGTYVGGEQVKKFERNFSKFYRVPHCVGVGNATDGLFLALKALGVGQGDEVITPAWSWISSAEVISLVGAKPVFAEVAPDFYTVTEHFIREKITRKTKAVIVVHLYGQAAEMTSIKRLCKRKGLFLIEDCSQSHLSAEGKVKTGTTGDCGVFSFYPTKNLGAFGDAGCIVTNNPTLAKAIRRLANHGGLTKDEHLVEGTNSRLDTLQAAILKAKLPHLKDWTRRRIKNAKIYSNHLSGIKEVTLPKVRKNTLHTFHLFVILAEQRNRLKKFLQRNGVQTLIHYPKALPFEPPYRYLKHTKRDFPVSSRLQNSVLSLPIYPELTEGQISYVCDLIKSFYGYEKN